MATTADHALCKQFLDTIRTHHRETDTNIRLAAVIRRACAEDPKMQEQLGLSDAELERLPVKPA